ncbi:MAG: DUF3313 family protein [Xanthomonadales bacterium]|nr:DUF3313 domain-containing protein [Gammaproteobacteria bacterium]NND58290.1 DUF3313 family protein [Xanthomonadales bacterium]NNK51999.1 DUF3313 family protein [Xanthomonadales bacterium]
MNSKVIGVLFSLGLILGPSIVFAETDPPEISLDGLELMEKDRRGEIYASPDVEWSIYDQILLDPATVAFRKNWQRDQNRYHSLKVKASDMERIKSDMADLFNEVFVAELTAAGDYTLASESAENVMRIKPRIVDLDVYAPDTRSVGITQTYTESAGRMTLKLELYDAVTGDLLATASDRQEAPRRGYYQWTNSVSNRADARRMLQRWAKDLHQRLDEARSDSD